MPSHPCTCTLNQAPGTCDACVSAYALTKDRATLLALARERLVSELRGGGHLPACGCECGKAASASALAAVVRELRATLAEIESLPRPEGTSASGSLAARVFAKTTGAMAPADHQ